MPRYEVYATRFDSTNIVDELVPARGLSFSLPLNDHGECSFTATVEAGRSFWRASMALPFSGVLVTRDGQPVWTGMLTDERPAGPRSFGFTAREWGWFFEEKVRAGARTWTDTNDHQIARDLITEAQAVAGQDVKVEVDPTTFGAARSDRVINLWDSTTVGRELRAVGDAEGGPEWYIGAAGTLDAPRRVLVLGDRLGQSTPQAVLEYVEDTAPYDTPDAPPMVALLGDLFPGPAPLVPARRAGGNVIAQGRSRTLAGAATAVVATGSGEEAAQLRATVSAPTLLARGWPRMTVQNAYPDVTSKTVLARHARADLAAAAGIVTSYSLVTLDGDPTADWTQTPRGSSVRVILDTDVYGGDRPVGGSAGFVARTYGVTVRVPDAGDAQVEWQVGDVLEVA